MKTNQKFNRKTEMMTSDTVDTGGVALTEAEYLASEPASVLKREYVNGRAYAMTGATGNHVRLCVNLSRLLGNHLLGKTCEVFAMDMKVKAGDNYFYPDLLVDCNQSQGDQVFCTTPVIIIEVLSKSTRLTDMNRKLLSYINIPTLQEYVLVEQDSVNVQVLSRDHNWEPIDYVQGDHFFLASIGMTLAIETIYDRVIES